MEVKEICLTEGMRHNQKSKTIYGHLLQTYIEYNIFILMTDSGGRISHDDIQVLLANI